MTGAERGFLLLTSHLGSPERKVLTTAQLRVLFQRMRDFDLDDPDRELTAEDLVKLGYGKELAERILKLLSEDDLLERCLVRGERVGCVPVTRVSRRYPGELLEKLGAEAPGCLWAKGDLSLLEGSKIAVVGSRALETENGKFAEQLGLRAAEQGYTLVSGNARGADRIAQEAALAAGGRVISVVADALWGHRQRENVLYLSEDAFDEEFSAQRALSRNRVIHALGEKTLVAQCGYRKGGTWDGTVKNLRFSWSPVFCFQDGSPAVELLRQMGANPVNMEDLGDLRSLAGPEINFLAR